MLPKGWVHTKLGDVFDSPRRKGRAGLPTLSVTLTDGLVERDTLDRKMETNLRPEEHLLVQKGELAYNMMRMWQGASGLAHFDAMVSPAYVTLRARQGIDPQFAAYFFKYSRMVHRFWAYSYGLTEDRLRLYFKDFSAIPVALPPVEEQRRITEILATWDQAIATVEKLLANAIAQKQAIMQKLLVGQPRLPGFSDPWKKALFGTLARLQRRKVDPRALAASIKGVELEHIEAETGSLIGTCQANQQASLKTPFTSDSVLFGKLRPYLRKYLKPDFSGVCSSEIWVLEAKKTNCLPEFLHLLVQAPAFSAATNISAGSKMPRAEWDVVKDTSFNLPPLDEQRAIAERVSCLAEQQANWSKQLEKLHQEKSALMQQLLTGKRRVKLEGKEVA